MKNERGSRACTSDLLAHLTLVTVLTMALLGRRHAVRRRRMRRRMRAQLAALRILYPVVSHKLCLARAKLDRRATEHKNLVEEHKNARLVWEATWEAAWSQGWNSAMTHTLAQHSNQIEEALREHLPPSFFCPILGELLRECVPSGRTQASYSNS